MKYHKNIKRRMGKSRKTDFWGWCGWFLRSLASDWLTYHTMRKMSMKRV